MHHLWNYVKKFMTISNSNYTQKVIRGVIFHETEEGYKNLERNQLVVSKLAYGIWQNLTRALEGLKKFHFNGLLLSKVYIVWAKKEQRNNLSWNWREIQNLERNRLVVSKIFILIGSYWAKYILFELKKNRNNLSWDWRGMQNLERNQIVVSKST